MIGRSHRFHGYGSLRSVYTRGQTVRGPLLSLKFAQRDPKRAYRVAVVVSRKVSKSAVVRNRIRRRIYEIIRTQTDSVSPGHDMIFTVFGIELAELDHARLESTIAGLLAKTTKAAPATTGSAASSHGIVKTEGNK